MDQRKANKVPLNSYFTTKEHNFCVNCGNELPSSYTINYCPNCGQAIRKENRILKYTSDGKPANQSKGQENISTKATDSRSEVSDIETPKGKEIARPLNYNPKYINKPGSGKGKAIGALIVIIIIVAIIAGLLIGFTRKGVRLINY